MSNPTICLITEETLDINGIVSSLAEKTAGALVIFTGIVRGETVKGGKREIVNIDYEAYRPMAEKKMSQIADEIRKKWPVVQGIAIVQRVGKIVPGVPAVVVACTAAHRSKEVFEATRYGIDRLKQIVPVWKKETGIFGEEWVEGEYFPLTSE